MFCTGYFKKVKFDAKNAQMISQWVEIFALFASEYEVLLPLQS
jgi:hypothetical protein